MSAGQGPNEAFELWWKDTFGEPKNANQDMTKSVAFHAWTAGHSKSKAALTVTKFELKNTQAGTTCDCDWICVCRAPRQINQLEVEVKAAIAKAGPPAVAQAKAFNEGVRAAAEMFESVGMVHNEVYSLQRLPAKEDHK